MLSSTDGFATRSRTYDTGARRLNQTAMIGDRDGDGRVLDDRGTGRAHVGALAAAGPRRGGRRLRVAVPLGPPHGALRQAGPVTLEQRYYPLRNAESYPLPPGGRVPLIVGGRGEKRTLPIVAACADEWNTTRITREEYPAKRAVLDALCRAKGREPKSIRGSLMVPYIVGRDAREREARLTKARQIFPRVPDSEAAWRAAGFLWGDPHAIAGELKRWEAVGVTRVMLQTLDMEDAAAIELLAREVVPAGR